MTHVSRWRTTADYDDLGYVGCRIVPPIRLTERCPFSAAECRLVLDYLLGSSVSSRRRVVVSASITPACLFIVRLRSATAAAMSGRFVREIENSDYPRPFVPAVLRQPRQRNNARRLMLAYAHRRTGTRERARRLVTRRPMSQNGMDRPCSRP